MINPPDNPARLLLPADWRVFGFGFALTVCVMLLFGLRPALRASSVTPVRALKGGEYSSTSNPRSRRRVMYALIAVQVAFCFLVLFVAGLFAATFERLSRQPTGFSAERLLTLDTVTQRPQSPALWGQVAAHLRAVPGVEKVALAGWPLLGGENWNNLVSVNGGPPSDDLTYFLKVSPGWVDTMNIFWIAGRDFRATDTYPGQAIVNETFVRRFFRDRNPIGATFEETQDEGTHIHLEIVGVVHDARYSNVRGPIPPLAYVPFRFVDSHGAPRPIDRGTFIVRTSAANPVALVSLLRREVARARSEFRVSNIRTQQEINNSHTVRERLLAMLGRFFAIVAVLLAGVGLYGVLDYSVFERRREIGIRMAIGAQAPRVAWDVIAGVVSVVFVGALSGLALGLASLHYVEPLLYRVKGTDPVMFALPWLTILTASLFASVPVAIRAVRIDPVTMLRAE
jgi:predicted permease